jgi:signal peptidase I
MKKWFKIIGGVVLICLLALLALFLYSRDRVQVTGGSMGPILRFGDIVQLDRESLRTRSPERGDVVAFSSESDSRVVMIDRIIGVPGDRVSFDQGQLVVNGEKLPIKFVRKLVGSPEDALPGKVDEYTEVLGSHTYLIWLMPDSPHPGSAKTVVLGPGEYFVAGDNRDNAMDSRYLGVISRDRIRGLITVILSSPEKDKIGTNIN